MNVSVGDLLVDLDKRREKRVVEVIGLSTDSVTVKTVIDSDGNEIFEGNLSEISRNRLPKAFKHKDSPKISINVKPTGVIKDVKDILMKKIDSIDVTKISPNVDKLESVYNRLTALENRVLAVELDGLVAEDNSVTVNSFTGSAVTNYPSLEEVIEKVTPQTETSSFEELWDKYCEVGKNPNELIITIVYKLLTE